MCANFQRRCGRAAHRAAGLSGALHRTNMSNSPSVFRGYSRAMAVSIAGVFPVVARIHLRDSHDELQICVLLYKSAAFREFFCCVPLAPRYAVTAWGLARTCETGTVA